LVLSDWCAKDRVPKVAKVTVPEIHEALCQQAAQQRRGGELEDDDDEVGEEARKEAEAKKSPFERKKVNKAQERQRIIDWARKRQPGAVAAANATDKPASAATIAGNPPVRMSASAPSLRVPTDSGGQASAQSVDQRVSRHLGGNGQACNLPAIGESSAHTAALPPTAAAAPSHKATAAERAAAYTAQYGAHAPPAPAMPMHGPSGAGTATIGGVSSGGGGGKARGAGKLRAAAQHASSMPGLGPSAAPKDLGTVIYLLGTQSNSMNARRFLRPDGAN